MPESSEPKLDWSKFGVEDAAAIDNTPLIAEADVLLTPESTLRGCNTGLDEFEAGEQNSELGGSKERITGSALPQIAPNLNAE